MLKYGNYEDDVTITKVIVEYSQPGDCCETEDDWQTLRLETMDNGVAPFIRMSIVEGNHFSLSDIHDLEKIFTDFKEKVNYHEK